MPKGLALHRVDFKFADFCKSNAFESYGVKTKLTSQYAILVLAYLHRILLLFVHSGGMLSTEDECRVQLNLSAI